MNFNLFNSIILAGIVQGFVFSGVVLFSGKYKRATAHYLTALIFAFSINNLQYYLQDSGIIDSRTLFRYFWLPLQLFSGPMLMFYGQKLLYPEEKIPFRIKALLAPFFIALAVATYAKVIQFFTIPTPAMDRAFLIFLAAVEFTGVLLNLYIVIKLLREVMKAEKSETRFNLAQIRPELNWFRRILTVFFVASFVWLAVTVQTYVYGASQTLWYIVWIFMSVMIYWLGHIGIYRYGIQEERRKIRSYSIEKYVSYQPTRQKNEHIVTLEKILVGDRRFLDSTIALDQLADEMGLSKSHLSRIINSELGIGFNDYLNSLRVEEAKSHLLNPDFNHYTLLAIGLEAGFNSKTTFNTAFKKLTSMTPSEFRKSTEKS